MSDKERLLLVLRELHLPHGQWALSGSGVMVLAGLRDHKPMGDVDIFVATRLWFDLLTRARVDQPDGRRWQVFTTDPDDPKRRCDPPYLYRDLHGIEVNLFFDWRKRGVGDIDSNFWLHNTQEIEGIPCIPLQMLLDWKREVGRAKDVDDIAVLEKALA